MAAMAHSRIVSQLTAEGYHGAALAVSSATGTPPAVGGGRSAAALPGNSAYQLRGTATDLGTRPVASFSGDGRYVAVGTGEGVAYVFEADALVRGADGALCRYAGGHTDAVNDVDFHPTSAVLVSGSEDATLHFYEYANPPAAVGRGGASRTCADTHPVTSCAFHPAGKHLLVGTAHPALHLYDVQTFRCFLSPDASQHHRAAITDARWAADGSMSASCAAGEVKLWDGGSFACVATLARPHGGALVGSVAFSRDGRYLLTSGADSALKLWDVRAMRDAAGADGGGGVVRAPRPLRTYEGGDGTLPRRCGCFSDTGACVIGADESAASAVVWASAVADDDAPPGGAVLGRLCGHARPVRCVAHAPNSATLVTAADDGTVAVWA